MSDEEFWLAIRRHLLGIIKVIERRWMGKIS
jgi:hypothetical protein